MSTPMVDPVGYMHWYKWHDGSDVTKVSDGHCPEWNGQTPFKSEPLYFHSSRDAEIAKLLLLIEQRQAELASVMRANSNKFDTITRLNKQLAECEKQVKMLRETILKRMASENRWPDYIQEALAATEPKP